MVGVQGDGLRDGRKQSYDYTVVMILSSISPLFHQFYDGDDFHTFISHFY